MSRHCIVVSILCVFYSISFSYSGGNGSSSAPYEIDNLTDLQELAGDTDNYVLDTYFILTADIDLAPLGTLTTALVAPDPVPTAAPSFEGTRFEANLDGNGYTISNLTISGPASSDYIGLIGFARYGEIKNLTLTNVNITGDYYVGAIAGNAYNVDIINCHTTGTVNGTRYVGGLAGYRPYVYYSSSSATVTGNTGSMYVGGLVGDLAAIYYSWATGNVTGHDNVGGLVGHVSQRPISYSFATGAVQGEDNVGGLVGAFGSNTITDCYATGQVTGIEYVGGLLGVYSKSHPTLLQRCYSTGKVTGTGTRVGGLIGRRTSVSAELTNCFWNTDTSETIDGIGNEDPDPATGITPADNIQMKMQSTFTAQSWDFLNDAGGTDNIWRMCIDGLTYPLLTWQHVRIADFDCPDGTGMDDLIILTADWLGTYTNPWTGADANADQVIDMLDLNCTSRNW